MQEKAFLQQWERRKGGEMRQILFLCSLCRVSGEMKSEKRSRWDCGSAVQLTEKNVGVDPGSPGAPGPQCLSLIR